LRLEPLKGRALMSRGLAPPSVAPVSNEIQAASPLSHVTSDDAPTYLVQGSADKIIPVAQTTTFHQALREAGVKSSLQILPGVPHGFRFFLKHLNLAAPW